jgi:signal transduction histidine kinase
MDIHAVSPSLLNSLGEGVTIANERGQIVFSNAVAESILGRKATDALPDEWADYYGVFLPDRKTRFPTEAYPLVRALQGEDTNNVELFIRNAVVPDGVLICATGRPLLDEQGNITGATVVFRDITLLRKAQEELVRANHQLMEMQKRQAELSAFIVHDLKSPLTGILGNADVLLERRIPEAAARGCLNDIRESARSLHRMVLDLLDVHLGEDGALVLERSDVNLGELCEEVRSVMAARVAETGQHLAIASGLEAYTINGDRELLRRVLQNLVDNGVKYGPPQGTIFIEAGIHSPESVLLRVRDEGPGVPLSLRERIFDKYAHVECSSLRGHDSRGLGLRFCQMAVGLHGGRIWVEDNQPHGASFCVSLPVSAPSVRARGEAQRAPFQVHDSE